MMQSNGLLLPPLPADGYVQTFTSTASRGRMLLAMLIAIVESFGQFWSGSRLGNGSVRVIKLAVGLGRMAPVSRSIAPASTVPGAMVDAVGWPQRSKRALLHVYAYGEPTTCMTAFGFPPGFWIRAQTAKLIRPSPSASNSAHASPVAPVPVQSSVESQLHNSLYRFGSESSRPSCVR